MNCCCVKTIRVTLTLLCESLNVEKQHKIQQTCSNFSLQWQFGCFDLCVLSDRPSASCCDIQTELRVISPGDLWLPHESCLISGGGSPGVCVCGGGAACIPAPEDVHRPATAATASLVSQTGGCLAADLQMTWAGSRLKWGGEGAA